MSLEAVVRAWKGRTRFCRKRSDTMKMTHKPASLRARRLMRHTMHLTLAVDHRVMDGVPAAEFLDRIVDSLERPFVLLCETPPSTC